MQSESFADDPNNLLSAATTEARSGWIKGRSEAWADRYGGHWKRVHELLSASQAETQRRIAEDEQRRKDGEELRMERERRTAAEEIAAEQTKRVQAESELARKRKKYTIVLSSLALCLAGLAGVAADQTVKAQKSRQQAEESLDVAKRTLQDARLQSKVAQFKADQAAHEKQRAESALAAEKETNERLDAALTRAQKTQTSSAGVVAEAVTLNTSSDSVAFSRILSAMNTINDPFQIAILGQSLAALGIELNPEQAQAAIRSLIFALDQASADPSAMSAIGQALSAVVLVSESPTSEEAFEPLRAELSKASDPDKMILLAAAMQRASTHLTGSSADSYVRLIADSLKSVANRLTPDQAEQASEILIGAGFTGASSRDVIPALEAIVPKLSPTAAGNLLNKINLDKTVKDSEKDRLAAVFFAIRKQAVEITRSLVCIGDGTSRTAQCPPEAQVTPCGATVETWAKANQCSIIDAIKLAVTEGGTCGYTLFQVQCKR